MTSALHTSALTSLPLLARGKVRDNYAVGDDRILMVASDRLSVPSTSSWASRFPARASCSRRWPCSGSTARSPRAEPLPDPPDRRGARKRGELPPRCRRCAGRSMLVQPAAAHPVEAVVRGYLAGSGWKEYQDSQSVCGVPLPAGLKNASKLPGADLHPGRQGGSRRARRKHHLRAHGRDDRPGAGHAHPRHQHRHLQGRRAIALKKGIIIADTKFEFGLDARWHAGADGRGAHAR
jgi:phosphoribosylaminoimidazole-succinocarboxamide synthase